MSARCRAAIAAIVVCLAFPGAASAAALEVTGLRLDHRTGELLGVGDPTPVLGWKVAGAGPVAVQTAFQVRVAGSAEALGSGPYLWDSGRVDSNEQSAEYAGVALRSRAGVAWQVRVWDGSGDASAWSAPARFELGLLSASDWGGAKWLELPAPPVNAPVTLDLGAQDARYVRLDVTKLGLPVTEGALGLVSRLQLAELELVDSTAGGVNRAQGATVTASNPYQAGGWSLAGLVDGVLTTPGYTSLESKTQSVNPSFWVQLDLGAIRHFDRLRLYPRTDLRTDDGKVPNFPADFTVQASATAPTSAPRSRPSPTSRRRPGPTRRRRCRSSPAPSPRRSRSRAPASTSPGSASTTATLNGERVTDHVLTPGNSNSQRSVEYGTYDVTRQVRSGANTLGVELGNGITNVFSATNPAVGRTSVYQKFSSVRPPAGTLAAPASAGATNVKVSSVAGYSVGATINVDIGAEALESREIAAVGTAGAGGTGITLTEPLAAAHASGASVSGSGPATQPGIAVTPRMIARLELTYADGTQESIVSDRQWRTARGPTVTDNWYAGTDYDARRVQRGWNEPGADLTTAARRVNGEPTGWSPAVIAPAPSLKTALVAREAPPVRVLDELRPVAVTQPRAGTWVFDFGQNQAGIPRLRLGGTVPAGTVVRMQPAELLSGDGTVSPGSTGSSAIYDTYTSAGDPGGETWQPQFGYHGYRYLQVTGLPASYTPTADTLTALQTHADNASASTLETSDSLVNTIRRMSRYSIMSNMQSVFTDCPHREKLGWLADMLQSLGSIDREFDVAAHLRLMVRHMAESQQPNGLVPDIAPEMTVFGGGFRDDPNWGEAIILTPYSLFETYGDRATMREFYPQMRSYMAYLQGRAVNGIVRGDLADWAAADTSTPAEATGTYAYYSSAKAMARMAAELGHIGDAASYTALADSIAAAFNARFFNPVTRSYTTAGPAGTTGSQAMDAMPLDMGIVPSGRDRARARRPRRADPRLPPQRRRPARQRRDGVAAGDLPVLVAPRARRVPVGGLQGADAAQLRLLRPAGPHHDPRVLGPGVLAEPHDPAADRRVVQQGPRRARPGAGLGRLRADRDQAAPRRRPGARRRQLRDRRAQLPVDPPVLGPAARPGVSRPVDLDHQPLLGPVAIDLPAADPRVRERLREALDHPAIGPLIAALGPGAARGVQRQCGLEHVQVVPSRGDRHRVACRELAEHPVERALVDHVRQLVRALDVREVDQHPRELRHRDAAARRDLARAEAPAVVDTDARDLAAAGRHDMDEPLARARDATQLRARDVAERGAVAAGQNGRVTLRIRESGADPSEYTPWKRRCSVPCATRRAIARRLRPTASSCSCVRRSCWRAASSVGVCPRRGLEGDILGMPR